MSEKEVERLRKEHEDEAVHEISRVVFNVNDKEIRRLLKEHGDKNKLLEMLTEAKSDDVVPSVPVTIDEERIPNGESHDDIESPEHVLAASLESLQLDTNSEQLTSVSTPMAPPEQTEATAEVAERPRATPRPSTARKQRQAKKAQKDAAKRRKRMEAMGVSTVMEDTTTSEHEHVLKVIVI